MTDKATVSKYGTNGAKALNYVPAFESRDPLIISQCTPGQWFKPVFHECGSCPKFQLNIGTSACIHMKRKGLIFCFSFTSPIYLLAGTHAMLVQMPDFIRNLKTAGANTLAVRIWESIADFADKAYTYFAAGNTKLFHEYMQAYNTACETYANLKNDTSQKLR